MIALGHDVEVWGWAEPRYKLPLDALPDWCRYEPFDGTRRPMWKEHLVSVFAPRSSIRRAPWAPAEGALAVADDQASSPLIERLDRSVATVRCREALDAIAVRRFLPRTVQCERAERRAARRAPLTLVHSPGVGVGLRGNVRVVPIACQVPPTPVAPLEEPVAVMTADWAWPPNLRSLSLLLKIWPEVRDEVPGAQLVLAGRGLPAASVGHMAGVSVRGEFARTEDILSEASVFAFPCPRSTGPKIKVLQALAFGFPVVTTPSGVEGLALEADAGALVVDERGFAAGLVAALMSPELRLGLGRLGRKAIEDNHSPLVAAAARTKVFNEFFPA
jgi:glycosyltransferase involved in cell wall biosynthesis